MIYTTPAKIFALFYTLFGVPIVFSTFSNTCHAIGMMCWRYLPCFKEKLTRSLVSVDSNMPTTLQKNRKSNFQNLLQKRTCFSDLETVF